MQITYLADILAVVQHDWPTMRVGGDERLQALFVLHKQGLLILWDAGTVPHSIDLAAWEVAVREGRGGPMSHTRTGDPK